MTFADVHIKVPEGMVMYLRPRNADAELERNALLLYPYINDRTISHGKAAEILGIPKYDLIELYDRIGLGEAKRESRMIVISDTTPLISLMKIGRLDLLNLLFWRSSDSNRCF